MRRTRLCLPINPELVVIGVDVAKRSHVVVAMAADRSMTKPRSFPATRAGFDALLAYAEAAVRRFKATGFVVAFEPTGHYGETLAAFLGSRSIDAYGVQPIKTNRAKELLDGRRNKTDEQDAAVIAMICRDGHARPIRHLAPPFARLRVLGRRRQQLAVERTTTANRIHRVLDVVFPELAPLFREVLCPTGVALLTVAATPAEFLALGEPALTAVLRAASRGQLGGRRARQILEAAARSVGVTDVAVAHRLVLRQLLDAYTAVARQVEEAEKAMIALLAEIPYASLLTSIPRLGKFTTAALLGELGDLRDYRVAKQLISMAGVSLVMKQSGESIRGRPRLTKAGRAYARQLLYLAALRMGWGVLAETRKRALEKPAGQTTKAAVANMARILRVMHAMVRDGRPFDVDRFRPTSPAAIAA